MNTFESDAKMVIKVIDQKKLINLSFDETEVNEDNIVGLLNIENDNYESLTVQKVNVKTYINIVGKNKWAGLIACRAYNNIVIGDGSECGFGEISTGLIEWNKNYSGNSEFERFNSVVSICSSRMEFFNRW